MEGARKLNSVCGWARRRRWDVLLMKGKKPRDAGRQHWEGGRWWETGGRRLSVHADSAGGLSGAKHLPNKEPLVSHPHPHLKATVGFSGHRPPTPSLPLAYGHLQSFLTTVFYLSLCHVRRSSPERVRQRTVLPRESPRGWSTTLPQRRLSVPRCALAWRSIFVVLILEPPSSPCNKLCSALGRPSSDSMFR